MSLLKNYKEVPLSKLSFAAWNYKTEDAKLMERLKANITANGAVENLVIRKIDGGKFEVVNGNHRLQAYRELNMKTALCYDMGEIEDGLAKRVAIELNETKFPSDPKKLAATLKELKDEFGFDEIAMSSPFDEDIMNNMINAFEEDWGAIDEDVKDKNSNAKPKNPPPVNLNAPSEPETSYAKVDFVLSPEVKATFEKCLDDLNTCYGYEHDPSNIDSSKSFVIVTKLLSKHLTKED